MELVISPSNPFVSTRPPVEAYELTNKAYVDQQLSGHTVDDGRHLTSSERVWLSALLVSSTEINYLVGVTSSVQTQISSKLDLSGGSMTGNLNLFGNPTTLLHAVNKGYADAELAKKLNLTGGSLTGYLSLHAAPTDNLHASTKKYVDDTVSAHSTDITVHISPAQKTWLNQLSISSTEANYLFGVTSSVQTQLNSKLNLSGGTLTGFLTTHADPTSALHVANKQYVDSGLATHTNNDALHLTASQNTWLDSVTVSAGEVNFLTGVTSSVQTQLNSKLGLSGGTMTGALILSGAPTQDLNPATKKYTDDGLATKLNLSGGTLTGYLKIHANPVDTADAVSKGYLDDRFLGQMDVYSMMLQQKLALAGGTMTGALVLSGDPTSALHAATKQYVDSSITTHTSNAALHLTSAQNTWLDAITATSAEVNYLSGVTSSVQTQLNSKLALAGGTLTGALTLSGAPTLSLHASTKQYVDDGLGTKLNLSGGTLTGFVTLHADPTSNLHSATKQYVDSTVTTHANSAVLHLTSAQNTWIDAITATATEVNRLVGVTSGVQSQLDSKLPKAGGTLTGDVSMSGSYGFFTSKTPVLASELTNKAYVDQMVASKKFLNPIICSKLIGFSDNNPPLYPENGDCYIVGPSPTGAWGGLAGRLVMYNNLAWHQLQGRAVAVGDRFGVCLLNGTPNASLTAYQYGIVTVTVASVGNYQFVAEPISAGSSTIVYDPDAIDFGDTLTYTDEGVWMVTNTSVNLVAMNGLYVYGKTLNIGTSAGLTASPGTLSLNIDTTRGLAFTGADQLYVKLDGTTLTQSSSGIKLNDSLKTVIDKAMTVDGVNTVTGQINVGSTGQLRSAATPTVATDVITKSYADTINTNLSSLISALTTTVNSLNADPVTMTYTNTELAKKLNLAGGTMTGALVLNAAPTIDLHAATKKYVDDGLATKLNLSGGTLTGYLKIHANPVAAEDAVSKGYLDDRLSGAGDFTSAMLSQKLDKVGGTMTGFIVLHADPTLALHPVTKQYADSALSAHATDSTIHVTSAQRSLLDGITATAGEINYTAGVTSAIQSQLNAKLPLAGGTMTGTITLSGNPTLALHAAPKQYVDSAVSGHAADFTLHLTAAQNTWIDAITVTSAEVNYLSGVTSSVQTQLNAKLPLAGGTLTGALTLSGAPTNNLHAATKQYVDTGLSGHTGDNTIHVTATQRLWLDSVSASPAEVNYLSGVSSNIQNQITARLPLGGGTMTGGLILSGLPTVDNQAANKKYVDDGLATKLALAGGTMTGFITLHADPTATAHAATKQYVDNSVSTHASNVTLHLTTAQNTWLDAITATSAEVNYLAGVTSAIQTQLNARLLLAGGTLTGALTLSGAPTVDLHAATKKYVDDGLGLKIPLSGGTMTGYLKLVGNPIDLADAVSKGYLDDRLLGQMDVYSMMLQQKFDVAGGTLTGFVTLHADPTSAYHASTKKYVDDSVTTLSNSTSTAVTALQTRATNLETTVGILNTDPVTKSYTDTQLSSKLNLTGGSLSGFLTLHSDPSNPLHAVTKQYVDSIALGIKTKENVRLATTANLAATYNNGTGGVNATLTGSSNGALSVDGKTAAVNDRILVRLQTAALQNGDYVVIQTGSAGTPFILRRTSTMDEITEIAGAYFNVFDGATLKGTGWVLSVADPTTFVIGTDAITVNQFFGPGSYIGGAGMTLDGNTFNIGTASTSRIVVNADNIDLATTGITAGTYRSVTFDAYGRATAGTNPTTLAGYGITDAPTLTGTGASGNWNINVSGWSNATNRVYCIDTRSTNSTPQSFSSGLVADFKSNSTDGLADGGTYHGVMTLRQYASGSDWTGGGVRQLGFTDNHNLWIRGANADTTWTAWTRFLKTSDAVSTNTANMVVARDASGNFSAGTITAALSGNATTATKAVEPTTVNYLTSHTVSNYSDGVAGGLTARYGANTATDKPSGLDHALLTMSHSTPWAVQLAGDWRTNEWYVRNLNNSAWGSWDRLLKASEADTANTANELVRRDASGNFSAGMITANLTGAVTGNASTATTLATARTINGVSFNGSANINLPGYDSTYRRIINPAGAWFEGNGSQTGMIAISLPVGWSGSMIRMTVRVYNYTINGSCDIHLGGYLYAGGYWVYTYVNISSNPGNDVRYRVRFGFNSATKAMIYIAEEASAWEYLKVNIVDLYVGHNGNTVTWESGWGITLQTAAPENVNVTWTADTTCSTYATTGTVGNALVKRDASGWINAAAVRTGQLESTTIISVLNAGAAQGIKIGNLVISNSYADGAPTNGAYIKGQISSGVATGTAPFVVSSTTRVNNLNVAFLDGISSANLFNNMGLVHGTDSGFNAVPGYGSYYISNGSAGPTQTSNHQFYGLTLGLGSEYNISSYASQLYWCRDASNVNSSYLYLRDREGGVWGDWRKIKSGQADTAVSIPAQWLSNGTMNVNNANTTVLRNENGLGGNYAFAPVLHVAATDTMWQTTVSHAMTPANGTMMFRQGYSGIWGNWLTVLSSANYNSFSPTLTGTGASGSWGISVTGNAATATVLQTARTINGVSFNGSANIVTPTTYDSDGRRVSLPGGGLYTTTAGTITGAIAIRLPTASYGTSSMIKFDVEIYEYVTGKSFTVTIAGYAYAGGNWVNMTAYSITDGVTDRRLNVRWAKDTTNGRFVVYIGELTSTWSYPQVFIKNVCHGYQLTTGYTSGWTIDFEATAFATVAATVVLSGGYYSSTNTASSLVYRDASGNFSAGTITAALNGNATTATTLQTARNISLTGDVTDVSASFNGSSNISLTVSLKPSGVEGGLFTKVLVNNKGIVTGGDNPTTLAGYGITDAVSLSAYNTKIAELEAQLRELRSYLFTRT